MGLGRSGIPDIIACFNGKFIAIECKAGNNKTTPLQERELNRIMNAGGETFIAREETLAELHERLLWMET
jgi:Holliday junction resolvase